MIPNSLRYKLNIYRRYTHWNRLNCIFVHVPKAAGTSINRALYGRTLGHYSASEIKFRFPSLYERAFTFSVVRNPWDRALSAYRFASLGRTDSMGVRKPIQYKTPDFKSFERFVCDWLPQKDIQSIDFIFRPQWLFVCDSEKEILVDHLGRFEKMGETVSFLNEIFCKDIKVENQNSTRIAISDYRSAYTRPEMVDIISSLYNQDIKLFGYSFE